MDDNKISEKTMRERLPAAIRDCGMTQKEIAEKLGLTLATVAHYVKGDRLPAVRVFKRLCILIDVAPNYLFGITDEPKIRNKDIMKPET